MKYLVNFNSYFKETIPLFVELMEEDMEAKKFNLPLNKYLEFVFPSIYKELNNEYKYFITAVTETTQLLQNGRDVDTSEYGAKLTFNFIVKTLRKTKELDEETLDTLQELIDDGETFNLQLAVDFEIN